MRCFAIVARCKIFTLVFQVYFSNSGSPLFSTGLLLKIWKRHDCPPKINPGASRDCPRLNWI